MRLGAFGDGAASDDVDRHRGACQSAWGSGVLGEPPTDFPYGERQYTVCRIVPGARFGSISQYDSGCRPGGLGRPRSGYEDC